MGGLMAGITLEQAQAQLDLWLAASTAVAASQSYEIAGRKLTRADAATIRDQVEFWDAKVQKLSAGNSRRIRYGVSS
jgi:hypothetical protein